MPYEVYQILNLVNQKSYIGATTTNHLRRYKAHLSKVKAGSQKDIHKAIREFGEDSFQLNLLETCTSPEHLMEREKAWISTYKSLDPMEGYNMTAGGVGAPEKEYTPDTKSKLAWKTRKPVTLTNTETGEVLNFDGFGEAGTHLGITASYLSTSIGRTSSRVGCVIRGWKVEVKPRNRDTDIKVEVVKVDGRKAWAKTLSQQNKEKVADNPEHYRELGRQHQLANCKPVDQLDINGNYLATFTSAPIAAEQFLGRRSLRVVAKSIRACCKGISKSSNGFKWRWSTYH